MVIRLSDNGASLVIEGAAAEKVFGSLGIDDMKNAIVYGEQDDQSATRVAWSIMYHGHPDVKMLDVGFQMWQQMGLPVTRDVPQVQLAQFKSKPRADIRIDADEIKTRAGDLSFVVVDARTPMEHMQARIPNSVLHNWEDGVGSHKYMQFKKVGYDKVKLYDGSIIDWAQRRNPLM